MFKHLMRFILNKNVHLFCLSVFLFLHSIPTFLDFRVFTYRQHDRNVKSAFGHNQICKLKSQTDFYSVWVLGRNSLANLLC